MSKITFTKYAKKIEQDFINDPDTGTEELTTYHQRYKQLEDNILTNDNIDKKFNWSKVLKNKDPNRKDDIFVFQLYPSKKLTPSYRLLGYLDEDKNKIIFVTGYKKLKNQRIVPEKLKNQVLLYRKNYFNK